MAKYATKGDPRSQCASEILNACVNRLDNTDTASSTLRRAMTHVARVHDIGSQETARMRRGVRTGDEDDENQGDQALDPSELYH